MYGLLKTNRGGAPAAPARAAAILRALACAGLILLGPGGCLPGYVRVILRTTEQSNQARSLRVLVRSVDDQQFRAESYASVSALVIKPDASVLNSLVLEPKKQGSRAFWVKSSKDKPLALYFLYTAPTASWKVWLQPELPWRITVPLGRTGVDGEHVRECRAFRRN